MRKPEIKLPVNRREAECDFCGELTDCFESPTDDFDICDKCVKALAPFAK